MMRAIVTVKLMSLGRPLNVRKLTGRCPLNRDNVLCTDRTAKHHSYLAEGRTLDEIERQAQARYDHITRIEVLTT